MSRYARDRSDRRYGPKVTRIELSEAHKKRRFIGALLFMAIGLTALVYGFMTLLNGEAGWQEISVSSDAGVNVSGEFLLQYNVGASGAAAGTEKREISALYGENCEKAYQMFTTDETFEDVTSLCEINAHPGETLTVDPVLYAAFEKLEAAGNRMLYYGPLYEIQENVCTCETDAQAAAIDPQKDADLGELYEEIYVYVSDPEAITLELLGDNQVRLTLSDAYQQFAAEEEIETFLDFYQLKNAFIIDYLADSLIEQGYTYGVLTSQDGYTRCLDGGANAETFDFYDIVEDGTSLEPENIAGITEAGAQESASATAGSGNETTGSTAGSETASVTTTAGEETFEPVDAGIRGTLDKVSVTVSGTDSIVSLRNFALTETESYRYYTYQEGELITPWLGGTDGYSHTALSSLTVCSDGGSCADLLLQTLPVYISDTFDSSAAEAWKAENIEAIYQVSQ